VHRADLAMLHEITDRAGHPRRHRRVLEDAGTPPKLVDEVLTAFVQNEKSFHRLQPDRLLEDGDPVDGLEVVWTPGHSPGHLCLYDRQRRVLFSGDHVLEHISPNIAWYEGRDALGEYLGSLDKVAQLDVDLIVPSHGSPFSGLTEWVRKTKEHHAERCQLIEQALERGPFTPHELVGEIWDRRLSAFHYRFAIFEVLAHLEHMRRLPAQLRK
jgi:glyoxylase-like metal-dependent hydrolase (beta-lactamase superfamily II)